MSNKRKHAELIKKWADNKDMKVEYYNKFFKRWVIIDSVVNWDDFLEIREYDPYRELKEAYAKGKTLQIKTINQDWVDVSEEIELCWGLKPEEYRIKPELEYIPFDFSDVEWLVGKTVRCKLGEGKVYLVISADRAGVVLGHNHYTFAELLRNFCFLDGLSCGKIIDN